MKNLKSLGVWAALAVLLTGCPKQTKPQANQPAPKQVISDPKLGPNEETVFHDFADYVEKEGNGGQGYFTDVAEEKTANGHMATIRENSAPIYPTVGVTVEQCMNDAAPISIDDKLVADQKLNTEAVEVRFNGLVQKIKVWDTFAPAMYLLARDGLDIKSITINERIPDTKNPNIQTLKGVIKMNMYSLNGDECKFKSMLDTSAYKFERTYKKTSKDWVSTE